MEYIKFKYNNIFYINIKKYVFKIYNFNYLIELKIIYLIKKTQSKILKKELKYLNLYIFSNNEYKNIKLKEILLK